MKQPVKILIADDEPLFLQTTGELLRKAGYTCTCVVDADAALAALSHERFDLILSDLNMPGNLRLELLRTGREKWPAVPLIVITGVPSLPTAIESVRLGITDYLLKPVSYADLLSSVRRALLQPGHQRSLKGAGETSSEPAGFPGIIGSSPKMRELFDVIERVSATSANVLITGESGTGKEVVARAIHQRSPRAEYPFQIIDCTAIPETLFESILFGHVKGSFTGAIKDQHGLLGQSDQGTVFFDEIGELPVALQAKLLRAVQEQTYVPVGHSEAQRFDARIVCATNRQLDLDVAAGRFRRDLYYRLAVIHIELPPLRERGDDVVLLAEHFLDLLGNSSGEALRFSDEVLDRFRHYPWPGNIRELRNIVESSLAMARSRIIEISDLPLAVSQGQADPSGETRPAGRDGTIASVEREYLVSLLSRNAGNVSQAARQAGMSRQGLHKLLNRYGIQASDYRR